MAIENCLHSTNLVFLLLVLVFNQSAVGCIFRWSTSSSTQSDLQPLAPPGESPLSLDKDTVSLVEQTLVKTLIELGKLKFRCPREDGLYPDKLDCRKYYECVAGNYTAHECNDGTGFELSAKSCVGNETVSLCQRVHRLADYNCNSTGLHVMNGQCDQFILCTGESVFVSSCNRGDLFDQKLKLCLPEKEANCDTQIKN